MPLREREGEKEKAPSPLYIIVREYLFVCDLLCMYIKRREKA
ncbi:hypothetical protein HanIR_Chr04g0166221 [Helianthus annuus]|nr:hypothetical protein HanIR_Chr04g0166221 [Helianthus annuus]